MAKLTWNESLSVGIPSVDEQHKMLVNIFNELNDTLASGGSPEEIRKVFDALKVYTLKHFSYEEKLFSEYGYPDSEEHTSEHQGLVAKIGELEKGMEEGNVMIGVDLMDFLSQWITHHIMKSDKAFSAFFVAKGVS